MEINWVDFIDIGLVSILLYQLYKLLKGSVAVRIFFGFLFLYLVFLVVNAADMELLTAILGQFMGVGVLAVIILFQQEIRKFLLMIGKSTALDRENILNNFKIWKRTEQQRDYHVSVIIEACKTMGVSFTGALIVFSKSSELKFYAESGDILDAQISKRLLLSIFSKNSPLHDGAVIIHKGRIKAARCILPVSETDSLPANYGLRHRAALGMSETTDTLVLVVSEETGQISIARSGAIFTDLSPVELRRKINQYLFEEKESQVPAEETDAQPAQEAPDLKEAKSEA